MASSKLWQDLKEWNLRRSSFSPAQAEEPYQDEPFLATKEEEESAHPRRRERRSRLSNPWLWTTVNALILGTTVVMNSRHLTSLWKSAQGESSWPTTSSDAISDAVRATSYYSPILKDMKIEMKDILLNGTLWPSKNPSWMRAEPSPETDAIWATYEPKQVFPITSEDIRSLGGDPATAVKFPEYFDLGDDAYMGSFDMLHKHHCLNELRKMTFEDYWERPPIVKTKRHGRLWWVHLRHCVDMLMQDQICHADADIVFFNWVDTQDNPWPNFGVKRRCRNWDQIHQWGVDRYVDNELVLNYSKPKTGVVELPFERGYYETYGFEGSTMFPNGEGYEW